MLTNFADDENVCCEIFTSSDTPNTHLSMQILIIFEVKVRASAETRKKGGQL